MSPVAFNAHNAFTRFDLSAFPAAVLIALFCIGAWYLWAEVQLGSRRRQWSGWRTLSFFFGLLAIAAAFASSVPLFANSYFQAHVIQHLLLMVVAPPLLALGAPSTLLLQTAGRATKQRWLKVLHSAPFALLSNPLTVFFLYFGFMFAFFLTSIINVAMLNMWLMDLINVMFLLGGLLYWWPMVGLDPIVHWKMSHGARLFNIILGGGVEAFLGVAILNDSHPVASMYNLSSTHAGGALLWASTELVTLGAFLPIYLQWMRSEDRVAARADRKLDEAAELQRVVSADGNGVKSIARPMSAWEAEWVARRGVVPEMARPAPPDKRG